MSTAQAHGGNRVQLYTADLHDAAVRRLEIEIDLRRALERNEIALHYQPKIETTSARIIGMEALIRWNHPAKGLISPTEFIPLAEETGLIVPLGEWVLRTACEQTRKWHDRGYPLRVAVNISARQLQQPDLIDRVGEILESTGLDANFLNLEVTESSIMNNTKAVAHILDIFRTWGIRISIDDFGTGHSSLGYLKHLPIDVLKIDKTFVADVTNDQDDAALVMAIISLAHTLGLKVVAEGVETDEQLRFLRLLRCDVWQGYLLSKPVPAVEFEKLLSG